MGKSFLFEKVEISKLLLNVEQNFGETSAKLLRGLPPDFWPEYIMIPLRFESLALVI